MRDAERAVQAHVAHKKAGYLHLPRNTVHHLQYADPPPFAPPYCIMTKRPSAIELPAITSSTSCTTDWESLLSYCPIVAYSFEAFSQKILCGGIAQADASIVTLRRHKEDGRVMHEFVTAQVALGAQGIWLRVERRVQSKAKFLTSEGSFSCIDSWDTVS